MKPEKQQLIHELLDGESRREATLLLAAKILRRRRHGRRAQTGLALVLCAVLAGWLVNQEKPRPRSVPPLSSATKPAASAPPQSLTDDQLLALFPNTPVGLATLPGGKKLLIFPRPGDEARFVTRL
jgi:ferric-dicitrate binding protein FerR (iron transport regulator)